MIAYGFYHGPIGGDNPLKVGGLESVLQFGDSAVQIANVR